MKNTIFKGAGTALITPFRDGNIDFEKYYDLIEFQIKNSIDAIIVCGTTGEASTLTDDEHKKMIEVTVEKVAGRVKVVAGTGSNDTDYSIELTRFAKKAGADAALCVTPYYNKTTQKGLVRHYFKIADSADIPMILYNVPARTNLNILPATYAQLAKHPNIVATKEANGNIASVIQTLALTGDELQIYSGNDSDILPILALGGIGVISTISNIMPKQIRDLCSTYFNGDHKEAAKMQIKYIDIMDSLFCEVNPIPVKTAAKYMELCNGEVRLPLCEMDEKNEELLVSTMKKHKLI